VVWSHNTTVCRATNFTPSWLLFRAKQYYQKRSNIKVYAQQRRHHHAPNEAEEKDLLELERLKAVTNL
jgi:hypothetical protein